MSTRDTSMREANQSRQAELRQQRVLAKRLYSEIKYLEETVALAANNIKGLKSPGKHLLTDAIYKSAELPDPVLYPRISENIGSFAASEREDLANSIFEFYHHYVEAQRNVRKRLEGSLDTEVNNAEFISVIRLYDRSVASGKRAREAIVAFLGEDASESAILGKGGPTGSGTGEPVVGTGPQQESGLLHAVSLAVSLSILWLLLSGHFSEPLLLVLGLASVLLVVVIVHKMETLDPEGHPVHLSRRVLVYWPWLVKEIVLANIDVGKAILGLGVPVAPTVFTVRSSQKGEIGRAIYANSITLTPGTVTIEVDGDQLTVHALTPGAVEGLESGEMDRRVTKVEGLG
jgi:multicomponent Na+:H+ antiporter subunit E